MSNIKLDLNQEAHDYFSHPNRNPVKYAELNLETGQLQIVFEDTEAYIDELEGYSIGLIYNTLELHHIWSTAPLGIKTNIHLINLLKKQNPPNLQKNFKIYYEACLKQGIDGDKAEWSWYAAQQANDPYAMIHVQNTFKEIEKGRIKAMRNDIVWENSWAEFMAMDENGKWWEYSHIPLKRDLCWDRYLNTKAELKKVVPNHKPDWKTSLIKKEGEKSCETVKRRDFTMNLISCDNCGIVLDRDKLPEVKIFNDDGAIIAGNAYWTGKEMLPRMDCPVCKGNIVLDKKDNSWNLK